MTTITVRTPSFARFRRYFLRSKGKSVLRCLEYERLSTLGLTGRVLDIGGGSKINYSDEIAAWGDTEKGFTYESLNIDPKTEPTYLLGDGGRIPVDAAFYDAIISLNTFEHIYELRDTFSEIHRVLKPDGRLLFIVPFIFRVHGHPDDYTRGTASFWGTFLSTNGFYAVSIEALTWGPFSTAMTVSGLPGPFKLLRWNLALMKDLFYFAWHRRLDVTSQVHQDEPLFSAPIAYFVQAKRR